MKNRAYAIHFVTLCVSAFLYWGLVVAEITPGNTEDGDISSGDRRRRGRVGVRAPIHPISIQF